MFKTKRNRLTNGLPPASSSDSIGSQSGNRASSSSSSRGGDVNELGASVPYDRLTPGGKIVSGERTM